MSITVGLKGSEHTDRPAEMKDDGDVEQGGPEEDSFLPERADQDQFSLSEVIDLSANIILNGR